LYEEVIVVCFFINTSSILIALMRDV
jgi:hypothetical protein